MIWVVLLVLLLVIFGVWAVLKAAFWTLLLLAAVGVVAIVASLFWLRSRVT